MTYNTLQYNGVEKSFADWGIALDSVRGKKQTRAVDSLEFTLPMASISSESDSPTFSFEGQVIVRVNRVNSGGTFSGGTVKFVGKRLARPAKASGRGQGVKYKFEGPWYDLANTDYLQSFKGAGGFIYYLPETVFNTTSAGFPVGQIQCSVGDQIQAILQWLLDQYAQQGLAAPFQYVGRALHSGALDMTYNSTIGTPGGDYGISGHKYNYLIQSNPTIDLTLFSLFLPTQIKKPMKCATALTECLEMSPRVNIWFDYAATSGGNPLPMIHFTVVDSMAAVTLPLFTGFVPGGLTHKSIDITPREDLLVRAVLIKYRITSTVNGSKVVDYVVDKWSAGGSNVNLDGSGNNVTDPNCGLRVINEIVDVQGYNTTTLSGHIDVEPVAAVGGTQASKRTWWSSKRGGELSKLDDSRVRFQDVNGAQTYIPDAVIKDATTGNVLATGDLVAAGLCDIHGNLVLNRVVRGTHHAWFTRSDGQPVATLKVKISTVMPFAEYNSLSTSGTPDTDTTGHLNAIHASSEEHVNIEVTNAAADVGVSGYATFNAVASSSAGESILTGPGGIASYLYHHLNTPQFEGDYVMVLANFTDSGSPQYVTLGNRLNLSGGAALWASMNAQIQEIEEDYGAFTTSVRIGISAILSAGQLSALFNMWRFRRTWYNPNLRSDNTLVGSGNVDMAKASGDANTTVGLRESPLQVVTNYSVQPDGSGGSGVGTVVGEIRHDAKKVTTVLAATTPTLLNPSDPAHILVPREICFLDGAGNKFYAVVAGVGGGYTKPA